MTLLTQRNATIASAVFFTWATVVAGAASVGRFHGPWVDDVTLGLAAVVTFFARMGFDVTPSGNKLPPATISQVDRTAAVTKAGDAIVETAAAKAIEEAKKEAP